MNTNPIRRAAVAAVVATASAASALSAQAATPTGKIVFSRSTQTPTSTPRSRSLWLLDVGTGQVRALTTATDSVYDMSVTWSPDGSNLVFERGVDRVREGQRHTLQVMSTTTNQRPHALIHGLWQFSKPAYGTGNRIAFTGEIYEVGPNTRYYEPLYVMNADGTGVRRITDSRVADHAYTAAQWSRDNVHVLVNRRTYTDDSLTQPIFALRMIDTNTRALTSLTSGYVEAGAWYEGP
jgi:Tol biopolymer transport system component